MAQTAGKRAVVASMNRGRNGAGLTSTKKNLRDLFFEEFAFELRDAKVVYLGRLDDYMGEIKSGLIMLQKKIGGIEYVLVARDERDKIESRRRASRTASRRKRPLRLTIELVPSTVWFSSLYRLLPRDVWNDLKKETFSKEGYKCHICGSERGPLNLHETWDYDDDKRVQKLAGVHHLCDLCHKIKHIGFWCHTDDGMNKLKQEGITREDLKKHFCAVNGCARRTFFEHEDEAFEIFRKRSRRKWKQDFGEYGRYIEKTPGKVTLTASSSKLSRRPC
jgi:hypothetical protein